MDGKGFKKFMVRDGLKENTRATYIIAVKDFERWLLENQYKRLEDADEHDVRSWAHQIPQANYLYGLKKYYRYKPPKDRRLIAVIKEMKGKWRQLPRAPRDSFGWKEFRRIMSAAEEIPIKDRDRALLNLLWSEMNSHKILDLLISDIDFENRLIRSRHNGITYHVMKEAWDALEKYVSEEDRGKTDPLFLTPKGSMNERTLQRITEKYFDSVKQKPKDFRRHCRDDLMNVGRRGRFGYKSDKKPIAKRGQIERLSIKRNLFKRLVEEIKRFGSRKDIQERIKKMEKEREFQTLLEGYLLAIFPDLRISREFSFKGWKIAESKIDFVVGKDQRVPIEVKLAQKDIGDHLRKGPGQVKEFLRYSGTRKGILVIGDQERNPERQKHSGMQDRVHIIII